MGRPKGSKNKLQQTQEAIQAPVRIDTTKSVTINTDYKKDEYRCWCCGNKYDKLQGHFTPTNHPLFKKFGYYPVCKRCTDGFVNEMIDFYNGSEEKAIEYVCMMYGLYFHESPLAASKKISEHRSRFHTYSSKIQIKPWVGKSWLDVLKERETSTITSIEEFKDGGYRIPQRVVKFFGLGFDEEEYKFMYDQYEDWITRHECKTKAQEELFKNLCIAQLNIQKASQGKINMKVEAAMTAFQSLLDSANLKPKQTNDNALANQNTFGTLIKKWENERPIPEPDEEWKDVDGIAKYITVYFLGHLCKMMGIKNSYSRAYEIEMTKYKVKKPEYEDDDEALFNSVFGGDKNDSQEN